MARCFHALNITKHSYLDAPRPAGVAPRVCAFASNAKPTRSTPRAAARSNARTTTRSTRATVRSSAYYPCADSCGMRLAFHMFATIYFQRGMPPCSSDVCFWFVWTCRPARQADLSPRKVRPTSPVESLTLSSVNAPSNYTQWKSSPVKQFSVDSRGSSANSSRAGSATSQASSTSSRASSASSRASGKVTAAADEGNKGLREWQCNGPFTEC